MSCFRSMSLKAFLVLSSFLLALPAAASSSQTSFPQKFSGGVSKAPSEDPYWKILGDPTLEKLVALGLERNGDVEVARQRVRQANAVAKQTLSPLLPSVGVEAGYNMSPFNNVGMGLDFGLSGAEMAANPALGMLGTGVGDTKIRHSVSALLKANLLVDIVGKNYAAYQGALRDVAAASADGETLAANITFLITQSYVDVLAAKQRLALIEKQIRTNEELLELVEARLDRGVANALDVLQQKQQLIATRAQVPLVNSIVATGENQLAILTGLGSVKALPPLGKELPQLSDEPVVGVPQRLLLARPEIRALTERLEAAEQREKNAFRALLPSLVLTGQVGYQANYIDQYDDGETWGVGALLSIPLYEGGRNWAALELARANVASAESARQQAVWNAVEEVESSLARYKANRMYYETLLEQLEASRLAFEEAQKRYAAGLVEYLNVLVILASHQQLELAEVQAAHNLLLSRIGLLRSLGGNWTTQLLRNQAE